jgi:hypothetical protein
MQIRDVTASLGLIVPMLFILLAVVAIVVWLAYGSKGGRAAKVAAWLGLTTLTLFIGGGIASVGLFLVYFGLGPTATVIAALLVTIFMVVMPIGWAYFVNHRGQDDAAQPR